MMKTEQNSWLCLFMTLFLYELYRSCDRISENTAGRTIRNRNENMT